MALRFVDGFDSHAATADFTKKGWLNGVVSLITYGATSGKFGGPAVVMAPYSANNGNAIGMQKVIRTTGNAIVLCAMYFKASALPISNSNAFIIFQDPANTVSLNGGYVGGICCTTAGAVAVRPWGAGLGGFSATGSTNICDNVFHWIEAYSKFDNSAGVFQVYVDGALEINVSGDTVTAGTGFSSIDRFTIAPAFTGSGTITIDDIIVYDDVDNSITGDLRLSSFPLGAKKIETLRPSGAGSSTGFTPSTGNNYQCVDETAPNDDTDYVSTTADAVKDLYAFGNLAGSPSTITAAVLNHSSKNADAGSIQLVPRVKSSSTEAAGPAVTVGAAYTTRQHNFAQDPNAAAAWTTSTLNAAEFGIESNTV